ncbi:hypothetical protein G5B47_02410 [Paenibacillus sp. 7124]|uniref:Uncharacterized protein n=1 Tax=Paenibacillus apii TaxID=1850370 RepID=A0A6M1PLP5_9BACL|nr:hypothetical protein [Paenibacillus apii]NGM81261.1 hypothetical protein [Paenibacillus apii]
MTTETKRDLHADLAICSAATSGGWYLNVANDEHCGAFYADDGSIVMDFGAAPNAYDQVCGDAPSPEDAVFIAEARTGWPHAIERAINAERWLLALVEALERGDIAQTRLSSGTDYVVYCAKKAVGRW